MQDVTVGQTFTRMRRAFVDGHWTDAEIHVRVTRTVTPYVDPWTAVEHELGVHFRITDAIYGVSHSALPLDEFLSSWAQ